MLAATVALTDAIVRAVAFLIRTEEGRSTTGITEGEVRTGAGWHRWNGALSG